MSFDVDLKERECGDDVKDGEMEGMMREEKCQKQISRNKRIKKNEKM